MDGAGSPSFGGGGGVGASAAGQAAPARDSPAALGSGRAHPQLHKPSDPYAAYQSKRRNDALSRQRAARMRASAMARQVALREVCVGQRMRAGTCLHAAPPCSQPHCTASPVALAACTQVLPGQMRMHGCVACAAHDGGTMSRVFRAAGPPCGVAWRACSPAG